MPKNTSAPKLTQERLKELLDYNPETGVFRWKVRGDYKYSSDKLAGYKNSNGYIRIMIECKNYYAHRLAWLIMEGYLPENDIDHINRNKCDNRFSNLREVSRSCNMRNSGVRKDSKTGIVGVVWCNREERYRATITLHGKYKHLGYFKDIIDAATARWAAEVKYDFPYCNSTSSAYQYIKTHQHN